MKGTSKRKEAREQTKHSQSAIKAKRWQQNGAGDSVKKKDILCVDYGVLLGKKKNKIKK
jgi:hypothetical protein